MLQPTLGVRIQRLLADDRASRQEKPRHARAFALVHYLGPNGRTPIRQQRAFAHRHLHAQPSPLLLNTHLKRNGAILVGPQQASLTASAQTTVSDIADALGITRRTVYRYFTSTEELFTAVADVALKDRGPKMASGVGRAGLEPATNGLPKPTILTAAVLAGNYLRRIVFDCLQSATQQLVAPDHCR